MTEGDGPHGAGTGAGAAPALPDPSPGPGPATIDPDSPPTDAELMRRHGAGDPDAFAEIVRRHRDRLWAVAVRTLGDRDEAADAVQDALVSAYRAGSGSAAAFRGEAAVTTWLHRIVVNACLDRLRRRAARPTVPLPEHDAGGPTSPDALGPRETEIVVHAALRRLPPDQAAAIVLVDLQGWSVEDAAKVLEVAPGTVKSRCSRGRAQLLPLLADVWESRPIRNPPGDAYVPPGSGPATGPTSTPRRSNP